MQQGGRKTFVMETVLADDAAYFGRGPQKPAPRFVGELLATVLEKLGPKGLEFARYSLDYHYVRNFLHTQRSFGKRADAHIPKFAKMIIHQYNQNGELDMLIEPQENLHPFPVFGGYDDNASGTHDIKGFSYKTDPRLLNLALVALFLLLGAFVTIK
eukprot:CAMPEP_0196596814 /NCGR_PEP_ID=MMETSP1081-20130531/88026_1 /TAXON_ID=36882 /ORGANISM="Pyramimonas amylifera, Strain CCMP720" /LENGTH=156 /DNA_ID=CAMNT_0041921973 /DNA_START=10 /DNA_END=480 /DNA_ORIENTATION=+